MLIGCRVVEFEGLGVYGSLVLQASCVFGFSVAVRASEFLSFQLRCSFCITGVSISGFGALFAGLMLQD